MALLWSGTSHDTPSVADNPRDYAAIEKAALIAREAVLGKNLQRLGEAVRASYAVQLDEGMQPLPEAPGGLGFKYCGGGFGGYALYLFGSRRERDAFVSENPPARPIEPFSNWE